MDLGQAGGASRIYTSWEITRRFIFMLESLPFLIPLVIFGVVLVVALGIFIRIPDFIASFLQRNWKMDPTSAELLGILGWVAVGFFLLYFVARNL